MLIRAQTGLLFCVVKGHQKITNDRTSRAKTNNGYEAFPVVEGSTAILTHLGFFNMHTGQRTRVFVCTSSLSL